MKSKHIKPGIIRITDKVIFEYYEFPKPHIDTLEYKVNLRKYEASKRSIDVENILPHLLPRLNEKKVDIYYDVLFDNGNFEQVKNNQKCKAEITKNTCNIIELIK